MPQSCFRVLWAIKVSTGMPIFRLRLSPPWIRLSEEITTALHHDDVEFFHRLYEEGYDMNACNMHRERLLHLACREGSTMIVEFLVKTVGVSVFVRDSSKKNLLHDVVFTMHSPNFAMASMLLMNAPQL